MYAVGIDISKGKSTIAIISIDGEVIENPFEISHTQDGINTFVKKIENYKKEDVKILMEATGHYHLPLLNYLIKNNYFVCVENALVIKKYCDIDLRKVKNDKKDSLKLATYCCEKWYKLKKYEPDNDIRSNLRLLSREYSEYINIQTRLKIKLTNLIDKTFPGIKEIVDAENRYQLLLEIYEKYPYPDLVLNVDKNTFINDIDTIAKNLGHRIGKTVGEKIYDLSPTIITSFSSNDSIKLTITGCIAILKETLK